jgi:K+-transporting ATPase ATPase C chain
MEMFVTSVRIIVVTMLICVAGYASAILGVALSVPGTARGSLLTASDGRVVGSRLIAQGFTQPYYFWPRPSAVDYNASAAGGSNKSPTSSDLTERARELISRYGASDENPLPAELAAASGAGLDPHITVHAALYQAKRVAEARGMPQPIVEAVIEELAFSPGGFLATDRLVNVLELNVALNERRR